MSVSIPLTQENYRFSSALFQHYVSWRKPMQGVSCLFLHHIHTFGVISESFAWWVVLSANAAFCSNEKADTLVLLLHKQLLLGQCCCKHSRSGVRQSRWCRGCSLTSKAKVLPVSRAQPSSPNCALPPQPQRELGLAQILFAQARMHPVYGLTKL